jgi:hypothetical protein
MSPRDKTGDSDLARVDRRAEDLVALLYGDLDDTAAERARAEVAADPSAAAELAGLERVRELCREIPDEEPPSRLSAQLLAEAARAVPRRAEAAESAAEDGMLARLVSWLMAALERPAVAAAASLVLVAGVAGVLYLRKGDELARPSARTPSKGEQGAAATGRLAPEEPGPVDEWAPEADQDVSPGAGPADGDTGAAASAEALAVDSASRGKESSGTRGRGASSPRRVESKTDPARKRKQPLADSKAGGANASEGRAAQPPAATVDGLSEPQVIAGDEGKAPSSSRDFAKPPGKPTAESSSPSRSASPAPKPPAPNAPPPSPPSSKVDRDSEQGAQVPSPRDLHGRAIDAALDGRCTEVRDLDRRVRIADGAYHSKVFTVDRRLASCLGQAKKSRPAETRPATKK